MASNQGLQYPAARAGEYEALEPKTCENCTRCFIRAVGSQDRYCRGCHRLWVLEPPKRSAYVQSAPEMNPCTHRQAARAVVH